MKRISIVLALVLFAASLAWASGQGEAEEDGPIQIGTSQPLTGQFSITGEKHREGYQHAVNLINQEGG
ncbi:MAG: hypothetical protein ACOCWU_05005 [Spirochaetota bacterium]